MLSLPALMHSYSSVLNTKPVKLAYVSVFTLSPLTSPLSSRLTRKEELPSKHASEQTTHLKYKSSLWGMHQYKQWWHRERTALVKCLWALRTMVRTNLRVCYIGGKCTCAKWRWLWWYCTVIPCFSGPSHIWLLASLFCTCAICF